MKRLTLALCLAIGVTAAARSASATVCAQIDTSRDTLAEGDRNGARVLFSQSLAHEGLQVVEQGCTETYSVYHVKLGNSITVFMQGPQGYRQATARSLDEVPAVYSQMVRSLISGQPMNTSNDTVDRNNVTSQQQAPRRVEADSLYYVRLGYGGVLGPSIGSGPALGVGYRYELDQFAIDFSFLNLIVGSKPDNADSSSGSVTGSWVRLMGLYFLNPTENRSAYLGGGLGWGGAAAFNSSGTYYSGSGIQGEFSAGYELLRASTIRFFVQADATLPFYAVHGYDITNGVSTRQSSYTPSFALSLGVGWGRPSMRVHVMNN